MWSTEGATRSIPRLTGLENLLYVADLYGVSRRASEELLAEDETVGTLREGKNQRFRL